MVEVVVVYLVVIAIVGVEVVCLVVSSMRLRVLGTCGDVLVLPPLSIGTLRCAVLLNSEVYRSGVDG